MTKVAVIGAGGWGKNHVRVLADLGSLAAVCDINHAAVSLAEKYRVPYFESARDMFAGSSLDAVVIATPTHTHKDLGHTALSLGLDVFMEKPMSSSVSECMALDNHARKSGRLLTCGYIERFNPVVHEAKKLMKNPICINLQRETGAPKHIFDVGIIFDTAVHDIDTAMYLLDAAPISVYCKAHTVKGPHEDIALMILNFDGGKSAILHSNWITPKKSRQFSITDVDKTIVGDFVTQELRIEDGAETHIPRHEKKEPLTIELQHFVDCVEKKAQPLVTPSSATVVTLVAAAAHLSAQHGKPIDVRDMILKQL